MPLVHIFVYYLIMLSGSCDILCFKMKCMYRKTNKITTTVATVRCKLLSGSILYITDVFLSQLEQLPETIGRLQNLLILNLCNNRLTSLPYELGLLKHLQTLKLGLNQLEALPSSMAGLKELRHIGLSDNRFTRIPSCLKRLNKLESINLDRNPLITKEAPSQESLTVTETLYLVKESALCEGCLDRCQTERRKLEDEETRKEPGLLKINNPAERQGGVVIEFTLKSH